MEREGRRDAEAQQQEVIAEEERAFDALEHADEVGRESTVPNDQFALATQLCELATALNVLRAENMQIRLAAGNARRTAVEVRQESISIRHLRSIGRAKAAT